MFDTNDYRAKHVLPKGSVLHCEGVSYVIDSVLGAGGTSVVYSATSSEPTDKLRYAIKEVFPQNAYYHRVDGIVCPQNIDSDNDKNSLSECRSKLEKEIERGKEVRNKTLLAVQASAIRPTSISIEGETFYCPKDPSFNVGFAILERMDEKTKTLQEILDYIQQTPAPNKPLCTGKLPKVYHSLCIMEKVLEAIKKVHDSGYIHGDISFNNVIFAETDFEQSNFGIALLLDFGCSRELVDGKRTVPVQRSKISSTKGYLPPELAEEDKADVEITKAADLYSTTCLMLRLLYSPIMADLAGISPTYPVNTKIYPPHAKRLGINDYICDELNRILEKGLQSLPENRYQTADEFIKDVKELKLKCEPPSFLLPPIPSQSNSYIEGSRETKISIALRDLEKVPVLLNSVGGIGKTEVAIQVGHRYAKQNPKGAYWITFVPSEDPNRESMEETILNARFGDWIYTPSRSGMSAEEQRKENYERRKAFLLKYYQGALIIFDNFDDPQKTLSELRSEKSFREITQECGIKTLFTTRSVFPENPEWEIKELPKQTVLQLMRKHCRDKTITDTQLLELAIAVDCHTLMCVLIAASLEESRGKITPEMLLAAFKVNNLSVVKRQPIITNDQNRDNKQNKLYDHLKTLFNLSRLDKDAKRVLCCGSLLPVGGMDSLLFENSLDENLDETITYLIKCRWLNYNETDRMIKIHPLIREVVINELSPSVEQCGEFLDALKKEYDENNYDTIKYTQMAEIFVNAGNRMDCSQDVYWRNAGLLFFTTGQYDAALKYFHSALQICMESLPINHRVLGLTYSIIGYIYLHLGNCERALESILEESILEVKKHSDAV